MHRWIDFFLPPLEQEHEQQYYIRPQKFQNYILLHSTSKCAFIFAILH